MTHKKPIMALIGVVIIFLLLAAVKFKSANDPQSADYRLSDEYRVHPIALAPPLDNRHAELSGMAWCQGYLMLLPQYPDFAGARKIDDSGTQSFLYRLEKHQIEQYLLSEDNQNQPLQAQRIPLDESNLREKIAGFDGYEAIACDQDKLWLTAEFDIAFVESGSYLVPTTVTATGVQVQPENIIYVSSQSGRSNIGDEALLIKDDRIITIHELNGRSKNQIVYARVFDSEHELRAEPGFPDIPYRITDVTALDASSRFWAINYLFENDRFMAVDEDPVFRRYGKGNTHRLEDNVERLLEFEYSDTGIRQTDRAPIQLQLSQEHGRNWEGIVRINDQGLLLVTDKHPHTYFGFVPFAQPPE